MISLALSIAWACAHALVQLCTVAVRMVVVVAGVAAVQAGEKDKKSWLMWEAATSSDKDKGNDKHAASRSSTPELSRITDDEEDEEECAELEEVKDDPVPALALSLTLPLPLPEREGKGKVQLVVDAEDPPELDLAHQLVLELQAHATRTRRERQRERELEQHVDGYLVPE
jgi:hypothetical protein